MQIPFEIADKIPEMAAGIRQRERRILKYCHSPHFTMEGLKELTGGDPRACPPEAKACGTRKSPSSH